MKRVVAAGRLGKEMTYDLEAILPDVGDIVFFRYTPTPLVVERVQWSPQDGETIAVVRPVANTIAFATKLSDLRKVD